MRKMKKWRQKRPDGPQRSTAVLVLVVGVGRGCNVC